MTTQPRHRLGPVADALAAALAGEQAAYPAHPSQLRSRLNRLLGDDARTYRADVHLVVTALDENVPSELRMAAPLTAADVARHADALAQARGWTQKAALRAVHYWADAMRLPVTGEPGAERPSVSLPGSLSTPESSDATDIPGPVDVAPPGRRADPQSRPGPWPDDGTDVPMVADAAETVLPRRDDPMATDLPDRSSVVAASLLTPAQAPSAGASGAPTPATGTGGPVPWPSSSMFAMQQAVAKGPGFSGAYYAFRGKNPHLRYGVIMLFAVVAVGTIFIPVTAVRLALIGLAVAVTLMVPIKVVRNGLMLVDDSGLAWYPALPQHAPAEVTATWDQVSVVPGNPPRLLTPQGTVWLKNRKGVLPAIESRAGCRRGMP